MSKIAFRSLVSVHIALLLMALVLGGRTGGWPAPALAYVRWAAEQPASTGDVVKLVVGFAAGLGLLVASVALICSRKWGRPLFLVALVASVVAGTPSVPLILGAPELWVFNLLAITQGAVATTLLAAHEDRPIQSNRSR